MDVAGKGKLFLSNVLQEEETLPWFLSETKALLSKQEVNSEEREMLEHSGSQ